MVTDVMLREATAEAERILLSHLPEDTGEKHVFSERFELKMNKLLRRTAPPARYRIARTVAAAAAVLLILSVNLGLLFKNVNIQPHPTDPTVTTPTDPTDPTEPSTAPTEPTTDPTEPSTDPTEPSTAPTDPVVNKPPFSGMQIFIYREDRDFSYVPGFLLEECEEGHLYYYYPRWSRLGVICDEPVVDFASDKVNFFFVKEAEPTKLYCAPQSDLTLQEVIYESDFGEINDVYPQWGGAYADKVVTLTEGNKRLVAVDIATAEVLLEFKPYYIKHGSFEGLTEVDGKPHCDRVLFDGKPTENDRDYTYFYWRESGTFTEMHT